MHGNTVVDRQLNKAHDHKNSHRVPHILCIDDDPDISQSIKMRLREYDVEVECAYFGMQGFWETITDHPDLVIMDLAMPNGDGQFVMEALRANRNTHTIPVIILTGMRDRRLKTRLLNLGANQFLTKPVLFETLLREINQFVDLRKRPPMV